MLLLPRPKATLEGFHRFNSNIGQTTFKTEYDKQSLVQSYKCYLLQIIGLPCCDTAKNPDDTQGKLSHWGSWAHYAILRPDNADLCERKAKNKKVKVVTLQAWIKKNHPEILKEYRQAI